jgi:hypothetical protein
MDQWIFTLKYLNIQVIRDKLDLKTTTGQMFTLSYPKWVSFCLTPDEQFLARLYKVQKRAYVVTCASSSASNVNVCI